MSRKVTVKVENRLIINLDDNVEVGAILEEMDYNFSSNDVGADIVDSEILDWTIEDSK